MAANGVIGITAQIVESTDIGGEQKPTPNMSMFERISQTLKNIRGNMGKMVGKKGIGIFWLLAAQSKTLQTVAGSIFRVFGALLDILMAALAPAIVWIITHLAKIIERIKNVILGLVESFKEIFGTIWDWVKSAAEWAWEQIGGLLVVLGIANKPEEEIDWEEKYEDLGLTEMTSEDAQDWAVSKDGLLVDGGTMKPEDYAPPGHGRPNIGGGGEEGIEKAQEIAWIYEYGPETPPDGPINSDMVEGAVKDGDLVIAEGKFTDEDRQEAHDNWFSWTDDIDKFSWNDVSEWVGESVANIDLSPSAIVDAIWPEGDKADGEEVVRELIDKSIDGEDSSNIDIDDYSYDHYEGNPGEGGSYMGSPNMGYGYFTDSYGRQFWVIARD